MPVEKPVDADEEETVSVSPTESRPRGRRSVTRRGGRKSDLRGDIKAERLSLLLSVPPVDSVYSFSIPLQIYPLFFFAYPLPDGRSRWKKSSLHPPDIASLPDSSERERVCLKVLKTGKKPVRTFYLLLFFFSLSSSRRSFTQQE